MTVQQGTGKRLLIQMGVAAILAASATAVLVYRTPPQYQARVQLLAMTRGEPASGAGPVDFFNTVVVRFDPRAASPNATAALDYVIPKSLPMPDYKLLFTNAEMGVLLRDWMAEHRRTAGLSSDGLTVEGVLRQMEVRTRVLLQTQNELRYQHVMELFLTAERPELAAGAANAWADWCVEAARNKRMDDTTELLGLATARLTEAQTARDKAAQNLETLRQTGSADSLAQQASKLESAQTETDLRAIEITQSIAGTEAQLASWEADAQLTEASARLQELRATLAGLQAEADALPAAKATLQQTATAARAQWAKARRQEDQYQLEVQTLGKSVDDLTQAMSAAKMAAEQTLPDFKVSAKAQLPEEKTAPHRSLLILTAALLGAAVAPILRFGRAATRRCLREMDAIEG